MGTRAAALMVLIGGLSCAQDSGTASVPGLIRAARELNISAQAAGIVVGRPVERNSRVKRGTTLIQIDPTFHLLAVQQIEARMKKAEADQRLAAQELERELSLKQGDSTSASQIDRLRAAAQAAAAVLQAEQAALSEARERLARCEVKAPEDGLVSELWPHVGESVILGAPVARLLTVDDLVAEAFLSPAEVARLKRGDEVRVTMDLPKPHTMTGVVRELAGAATNGAYRMRVSLPTPPPGVLPGFSVRVLIPERRK